jgi:hypothetical protein
LYGAMKLYAMHYFMGRLITITNGSGEEAFNGLQIPMKLLYDLSSTSQLLNRQLKHTMLVLLQETTRQVLESLEKELRSRTKVSWAPCFCVILILCICAEELQVAVDGFTVHKILSKDRMNRISREDGVEISRRLDDLLYRDCANLFHGIHRSRRPKTGQRYEHSFNPIRDGVHVNEEEGLTQAMHDLVEEIREILAIHSIINPCSRNQIYCFN